MSQSPSPSPIEEIKEDEELEFDENDNKIMQLYEVINELIDEQKARAEDLELLYNGQGTIVLQNVERRNDSVLNQLYTEMQLKDENDEEEDEDEDEEDSDDDESEDEQDQGWEIYNSVVMNLNNYMQQLALFATKLKEQNELIDLYEGPQEDEIKELESVVEEQTIAIEQQIKRNEDLESALSNVLNEYSNRITLGNQEISSLHKQLSQQNKTHQQQLKQLREMYEKKINTLKQTSDNQYKEEVNKLIDTLDNSRLEYAKQFEEITKEMSEQQTSHHHEMISLTQYNQTLTNALKEKTILIEELKNRQFAEKKDIKQSLKLIRTKIEIDDEDEFTYSLSAISRSPSTTPSPNHINAKANTVKNSNYTKKNRSFTPSKYNAPPPTSTSSSSQMDQKKTRQFTQNNNNHTSSNTVNGSSNNTNMNNQHSQSSNTQKMQSTNSKLQAKYANLKYKSKGYKSRSHKNKNQYQATY